MRKSFAQIPRFWHVCVLALTLTACASLPPPTAQLAAAEQALLRADALDADQYASTELLRAREGFAQAQHAMSMGHDSDARRFALLAEADAELAQALSRQAVVQQQLRQRRAQVQELERALREASP